MVVSEKEREGLGNPLGNAPSLIPLATKASAQDVLDAV